ncbi:hypothetical protein C5Y96_07215 [Blastopirellula marina]|uniref:Uncharacterized protein n=1 Tax=Blastopirellula marina TaxID=124 RepID=A0A2S8FYL9_9BACT|nr:MULTISPECIES: hypothetical protein [Pirellulaceae]PQO36944.1 hypothetical protein C5Y96_07215 [Blastopirellula marina]RCS53659.1 hypothetical protein DTL36_07225 [Bremerella cremea]
MPTYDLFNAWFRIADWCAYTLAKQGCESVVLKPLGEHSHAAAIIVREASQSGSYMHRKLAASLAGWIRDPSPQLLEELFKTEADYDASLEPSDFGRLESQSVMEDIVVSAHRWMRDTNQGQHASHALKQIIGSTIAGQYWNSAGEAMIGLCKYHSDDSAELLQEFAEYANGPAPSHPSRPSLKQEKSIAQNLLEGNPKALDSLERFLQAQDAAADTEIDPNSRAAIDHLLAMAKTIE